MNGEDYADRSDRCSQQQLERLDPLDRQQENNAPMAEIAAARRPANDQLRTRNRVRSPVIRPAVTTNAHPANPCNPRSSSVYCSLSCAAKKLVGREQATIGTTADPSSLSLRSSSSG
jgi:hypothetical protein